MQLLNPRALGVLLFCLAFYHSEGAGCGLPKEYGGEPISYYFQSEKIPFPWSVAITNNLRQFRCLGSIIPENYAGSAQKNGSTLILTAGSCFRNKVFKGWGSASSYRAFAGIERYHFFGIGATKASVKNIRILPLYTGNEYMWYGVALVILNKPFIFNKRISPVCISKHHLPPDAKRCFVSTYINSKLDEEGVNLVPGSQCDFGQFPELKNVDGVCSIHQHANIDKSFGGPLTCIVDDKAYQFGIYLSQMVVKDMFRKDPVALHYYGHFSKLLSRDPQIENDLIELGIKSSTSPTGITEAETKEPAEIIEDKNPVNTKVPEKSVDVPEPSRPVQPVAPSSNEKRSRCGDTSFFERTLESYVEGNASREIFPWNVFIATRTRGIVRCIGSLIHSGEIESSANASDIVLTAGDCFRRYSYSTCITKTNLVVYAGSSNYAWYSRKGIKVSIETSRSYGISGKSGESWNEIALLRLRKSLTTNNKVIPVCLAPREELPPFDAVCYVTYYDRNEHRVDEEPVVLTTQRRCPVESSEKRSNSPGLCTLEDPPKHHVQLGAPMVCIVKGRAYQYGVYLRQLSLEINTKASQKLGYYAEMSIVHSILLGEIASGSDVEKVVTVPKADIPKPEREPSRPTWPVVKPLPEAIIITPQTPGYESISASSSSQEVPESSKTIDFPYQILPSPTNKLDQMPVFPVKPPMNVISKSSSTSLSTSKSRSSSAEQSIEEITELHVQPVRPTPEAESPVLKKNETVIIVKFPALKYPKFVPRKEVEDESVIVLPPGSSETKDSDVPTTTAVYVSTPSPERPQPVPSTPAPVKLESHLESSAHSMSTSSSLSSSASASGEIIKSPGIEEIPAFPSPAVQPSPAPIAPEATAKPDNIPAFPTPCVRPGQIPASQNPSVNQRPIPVIRCPSTKPPIPSKPSCLLPREAGSASTRPNGITICPNRPSGEGSPVQAVLLPTPLPSQIYLSTSSESAERLTVPSLKHYDISTRTISVHEHILVRDKISTESSAAARISSAYADESFNSAETTRTSGEQISEAIFSSQLHSTVYTPILEETSLNYLDENVRPYVSRITSRRLPGAVAVHIFDASEKSSSKACSGSLIVKRGQVYADEVVTAARCVWPQIAEKYNVYVGSLLPRQVTETNFQKTVVSVESIRTLPLFTGASYLRSIGAAVLKLKHKVKVSLGVQYFPLANPETGPTPRMRCFVSGVCKHGLPVRVQYQLLSPLDCRRRLGFPFLPSLYYCGIGRKDILEFPSGAPLVCDFFGTWVQFGVYDYAPASARVDHFGNADDQSVNEVAIFMRVNGTSADGRK
ncbi:hypothetical protein M514_00573 [Trichuris suis]|uniref:Peptidase S1 domain-containing protein n=1 Tax=Trichuris suis TaxID=68888 RepID=A0A085MVK4_9BILA|nr:hypothetical protein M513_00573 [Trichuris suis]KFD61250.1 hypothetical protein M514_00573 [Trichuris suis]